MSVSIRSSHLRRHCIPGAEPITTTKDVVDFGERVDAAVQDGEPDEDSIPAVVCGS
jgi:hypothetical protein